MSTTKYHEMAAAAMLEAGLAEEKLAELVGRLGVHFARVEPFAQAGKYVRGLMSDLPRKNCWTLAEYAGDRTPDRMQRLLERACWDTVAAMGTVRNFVVEHLGGDGGLAVLVLDESGDEKTGTATCGVKRQYVGCAGKVANAVNFVNAAYSTPRGHALIGSGLYIPAEHLDDEGTRARMGINPDHKFKTKAAVGRRPAHQRARRRRAHGLVHRRRGLRPGPWPARDLRETRDRLQPRRALLISDPAAVRYHHPRRRCAENPHRAGLADRLLRVGLQRRPPVRPACSATSQTSPGSVTGGAHAR
ncbi:transposase [Plantactinospora sp. ZYX-F-223]|uniref:IS701 family transposase n=1 Tax=Plantactinospora sp. ZYX-F-223 TaxID=3144103 RepID=UPI0031FC99F2